MAGAGLLDMTLDWLGMSRIPHGSIKAADPPAITSVDFLQQVLCNINEQLRSIDRDVSSSQDPELREVRLQYPIAILGIAPPVLISNYVNVFSLILHCS